MDIETGHEGIMGEQKGGGLGGGGGEVGWGGGGGLLMKASPAEAFMFTKID